MKRILMLLTIESLVFFVMTGCATTVGPKVITNSHIEYNEAVRKVISEEVLLNIVRRRYGEPPQFFTISSITTQLSNSVGAGVNGSGQWSKGTPDVYGAGVSGNASFSDSPAISIVPRSDYEIIQKMTQRIFYDTPQKLANIGYRYDLVMALTIEGAGRTVGPEFGIENDFRPGTPEYVELVQRIRSMIEKNQLIVGTIICNDPYAGVTYSPEEITIDRQMTAVALGTGMGRFRSFDDGKSYFFTDQNYYSFLWMDEESKDTEDGKRIIELLNVKRDPIKTIWKVEGSRAPDGLQFSWERAGDTPQESIYLWPRSFYSVLNYVSFSVDVPEEEIAQGIAFSTSKYEQAVKDGLAVDVSQYLTIHWSKSRPENAFVAVHHRGKWFYIDDRDFNSKRFFNAVFDLYNIEIAPASASPGPVLTLPLQ